MTGVQVFLMVFGAVLALIGVLVFFLLAWFKETTGQDHHNAIRILQAEFRFSNPALVIFAGGLLLMVAPFFIGNSAQSGTLPSLTPVVVATPAPTVIPAANPTSAPAIQPTPVPSALEFAVTPALSTPVRLPTNTPIPPTATLPTAIPTPVLAAPDPTGRWRNESGFLEFRRVGANTFAYVDFDSFGNQLGQGTATQDEASLSVSGEGFLFDSFGNLYYVVYTGDMILDGESLKGDLYDTFGNFLGSVSFTRDPSSLGQ